MPKRSGFREIEVVAELVVAAYRYVSGVIPNVEYSCPCFVIARKAFPSLIVVSRGLPDDPP